jgi:hypothetical protein
MFQSIARGVSYAVMLVLFLVLAVMAYGVGGIGGVLVGSTLALAPGLFLGQAEAGAVSFVLAMCGALLGAGYALILLWRSLIAYLQGSNDENLRALGNFFDELRHAVRTKH